MIGPNGSGGKERIWGEIEVTDLPFGLRRESMVDEYGRAAQPLPKRRSAMAVCLPVICYLALARSLALASENSSGGNGVPETGANLATSHVSGHESESSSDSNRDNVLNEVIVTARRQYENMQTVPISMTVFSADDLREHNVTTMQDLSMLVPSLAINNETSLGSALVLRGQGTILGAPPGVIVYFAEVPVIDSQSGLSMVQGGLTTGEFYDLANVQVLNGPQGTLFGRNTTGGAILITPQRPTDQLDGYAQLTVGEYGWREFEGATNVPLANQALRVRLSADISTRDGYTIDVGPSFPGRDYDNRHYQAARLSAVWTPFDGFENYLIANIYNRDQHGPGNVLVAVSPDSQASLAFPAIWQYLAEQQARGPRSTSLSADQIDRQLQYGFFDTTTWSASKWLQLKNIIAYQADKNTIGATDFDGTPFPLQDLSILNRWSGAGEKYTEELQLSGRTDGTALKWLAGVYYEYGRPTDTPEYVTTEPTPLPSGQWVPISVLVQGGTVQRSLAVYGQGIYDLSNLSSSLEHMRLTAGVRYTWDKATQYSNIYIPTFGNVCVFTPGIAPACQLSLNGAWSAPTATIALEDQLTPEVLAYLTIRRGYKSGGFNTLTPLTFNGRTFDPEYVTDTEIGLKADWDIWGIHGRSDVDAFYTRYEDIQRTVPVEYNDIASPLTVNAARATIAGFEMSQTLGLTEHFEALLSYSYLESTYNSYVAPVGGDLSNKPFPYTPRNKVSLTGLYRAPLPLRLGQLAASATYSYQSAVSGGVGGGTYNEIEGYGLLNLRVNWRYAIGSPLEASLFVTNATNKTHVTKLSESYTGYGVNYVNYGEPRIVGAQLRYSF